MEKNMAFKCRFVVGSPSSARSSIWSVSVAKNPKSDVYVTSGSLGGTFKVSLQQSGDGNVSFTREFQQSQTEKNDWPFESRHRDTWNFLHDLNKGWSLALRIWIPRSELRHVSEPVPMPDDVTWLHPAPDGFFTEIAIIFTVKPVREGEWPAQDSMRSSLVATTLLANGLYLWVVSVEHIVGQGILERIEQLRNCVMGNHPEFSTVPKSGFTSTPHFILGDSESDGSRFLMEVALDTIFGAV